MMRHVVCTLALLLSALSAAGSFLAAGHAGEVQRPNILWITSEDNGPYLGCYGDPLAQTPNLDRLAAEGIRYRHALANAPVCSSARTTLITGMYATTLGLQHHRSRVAIPAAFQLYPVHLRSAGYYCTNNSKTDYNVEGAGQPWDESSPQAHYRNRKPSQPFFAVFNFTTSHESQVAPKSSRGDGSFRVPPAQVVLPPYHPDTPEIRRDWSNYYDQMSRLDEQIGNLLTELAGDGLSEETIVVYCSDHGGALPRGKRNLHDSGTRVPLIFRFPKKWAHLSPAAPGEWVDQPVSFVDLTATLLDLCGVPVPEHYQGRVFVGPRQDPPREHVFLYRGRMDERYDTVRAIRDRQFRYIRNYSPQRSWGQHYAYPFQVLPSMRSWHAAFEAGKCNEVQARYWHEKPAEELYDVSADPFEIDNLVDDPRYASRLTAMRRTLRQEMFGSRDTGFIPEGMLDKLVGQRTVYDFAHSSDYPIERIVDLADKATSRNAEFLNDLATALDDPHPVVRYWGAIGCLVLKHKSAPLSSKLRTALDDPSLDVRVAAAEALGYHGQSEAALSTLAEVLERGSLYERLAALNSLDFMREAGHVSLPRVQQMTKDLKLKEPADRIPRYFLSLK